MQISSTVERHTAGVYYTLDHEGRSLPIIDVTHPAFSVSPSEAELTTLTAAYARDVARMAKLPRWLQSALLRLFLSKSVLGRGLLAAEGGFLDGMSTYRLKLGAQNTDQSQAFLIDRKITGGLAGLSVRLRLQDVAEFLTTDLTPRLAAQPGKALHLLNIAGGPSIDSLNVVISLRKQNATLLHGRSVRIHVFDQDEIGPAFAGRALKALSVSGAPLAGLDVALTHTAYRWDKPDQLRKHLADLPRDIVVAVSSEGGLFDYGSDDEIVANLEALRDSLPEDTAVAGSVTRADAPGNKGRPFPRFTTRPRELAEFEILINRAHWFLERHRLCPFSFNVLLSRRKTSA